MSKSSPLRWHALCACWIKTRLLATPSHWSSTRARPHWTTPCNSKRRGGDGFPPSWNQAPQEVRGRATEELPPCSTGKPGGRAVGHQLVVHGQENPAVLKYF